MRSAEAEPFVTLDALPDAAADFFAAATDDLFASRAWYRTIVEQGMAKDAAARFVLCRSAGRPVAVFPMQSLANGRALASLTSPYTCRFRPLIAAGVDRASLAEAFGAFVRFCRSWPTARIDALPADWALLDACTEAARAGRPCGVPLRPFRQLV